jgi:hypothetical protein
MGTEVLAGAQVVIYPDEVESSLDFGKGIQIRWPDFGQPPFILCVGTAEGDWNILSGLVGQRRQQLFDLSDLSHTVATVFVQIIWGEGGEVGPVIRIHRD